MFLKICKIKCSINVRKNINYETTYLAPYYYTTLTVAHFLINVLCIIIMLLMPLPNPDNDQYFEHETQLKM
jgi:hypothetical protein